MKVYGKPAQPYFRELDRVLPGVPMNGNTDYYPRCGGILVQDLCDLACFWCGWRECGYFISGGIEDEDLIKELMYNLPLNVIPKLKVRVLIKKF